MTLVTLNSPKAWPGFVTSASTTPAIGTDNTLTSVGHYQSFIFCAPQAMTISHVGFRVGTAVGSPTVDVRGETVGTDGLPTGTLWGTNTNIVSGTITTNSWNLLALTASISLAAGQVVAIKIALASGTSLIITRLSAINNVISNLPYEVVDTTGTPVKQAPLGTKTLALGSSSTSFYSIDGTLPATAFAQGAFNNTNGARRGLRFQVPFACRIVGILNYDFTSVGDFNAILMDDAGSELSSSSTAFDGDQSGAKATGVARRFFDNPVVPAINTWYRAVIEPSSATNANVSIVTLPSSDYRAAHPGGLNQHYTTFASAAWDDTQTAVLPLTEILIDQVDDGTGSGGGGGVVARVIGG